MNRINRILKLLLALTIITALVPAVSATAITITGGSPEARYSAYRLLDASDSDGGNCSYSLTDKYAGIIREASGKQGETEAISFIAGLDANGIRAFADSVYRKILAASIEADYLSSGNRFEDVAAGYYLIAETKTGGGADIVSLVMLDTAGRDDIEIETKEDIPSILHEVSETNDSTGVKEQIGRAHV